MPAPYDTFAVGSTNYNFHALANPTRERGAKMSIRDVVGGSYTVVQYGGAKSMRLMTILFFETRLEYIDFEAQIGMKGLLEIGGLIYLVRLLEPVRMTTSYPTGEVEATATFLEVDT